MFLFRRPGAVIEDLDILPYLDTVLLSENEGVEKPSPQIFQRACERLGIRPEETVHVGDELDWCVKYDMARFSFFRDACLAATIWGHRGVDCRHCYCEDPVRRAKRNAKSQTKT